MGKDLNGKSLGKGISQRKDGRYEARALINGTKIQIYNMSLSQLRKNFETEKANQAIQYPFRTLYCRVGFGVGRFKCAYPRM